MSSRAVHHSLGHKKSGRAPTRVLAPGPVHRLGGGPPASKAVLRNVAPCLRCEAPVHAAVEARLTASDALLCRVAEGEWGLVAEAGGWLLDVGVAVRDGLLTAQAEVLAPGRAEPHLPCIATGACGSCASSCTTAGAVGGRRAAARRGRRLARGGPAARPCLFRAAGRAARSDCRCDEQPAAQVEPELQQAAVPGLCQAPDARSRARRATQSSTSAADRRANTEMDARTRASR